MVNSDDLPEISACFSEVDHKSSISMGHVPWLCWITRGPLNVNSKVVQYVLYEQLESKRGKVKHPFLRDWIDFTNEN